MSQKLQTLRALVPDQVWAYSTSFKFLGLYPINNNGLIIRTSKADSGEPVLVAANAPELSSAILKDIRALEEESKARVEWILVTDFHHLHVSTWIKEFPQATVLFPAKRAWRIHESENFKSQIMNAENPEVPNIKPGAIQLVPWIGFNSPKAPQHPDEQRRAEYSIYLPQYKFLYMFDVFIPTIPFRKIIGFGAGSYKPKPPTSNFGKRFAGFIIDDPQQCAESAGKLLALDVDTICFSHGDFDYGAIVQGKELVKSAMQGLHSLLQQ